MDALKKMTHPQNVSRFDSDDLFYQYHLRSRSVYSQGKYFFFFYILYQHMMDVFVYVVIPLLQIYDSYDSPFPLFFPNISKFQLI